MKGNFVYSALISAVSVVFPLAVTGVGMHANPNSQVFLLLVIDFDDFMCSMCLDSVMDFCRALPVPLQKKQVWGVIVYDRLYGEGRENLSDRILEKKIRGFVKANNLKFPVLLDRDSAFFPLVDDGTAAFVFNGKKQTISKFVFPLDPDESRIIQESLRIDYRD